MIPHRTSNCQQCYQISYLKQAHTIRSERCSIQEKWGFRVVNKFSFISLLIMFGWNRRLWPTFRVTGLRHLGKYPQKYFQRTARRCYQDIFSDILRLDLMKQECEARKLSTARVTSALTGRLTYLKITSREESSLHRMENVNFAAKLVWVMILTLGY